MKFDVDKWKIPGVVLLVVLVFFYIILGLSGALTVLGIVLLFVLPIYFILSNFDLDEDEKMVFSFFVGVGILPSLTFWMALYISFKIAVAISLVILIAVGFLVKKLKVKKHA